MLIVLHFCVIYKNYFLLSIILFDLVWKHGQLTQIELRSFTILIFNLINKVFGKSEMLSIGLLLNVILTFVDITHFWPLHREEQQSDP